MVNLACFALFAVATAVSMPSPHHAALAANSSSTAHSLSNLEEPIDALDILEFDILEFHALGKSANLPRGLFALESLRSMQNLDDALRGMQLISRRAHEGGAFYLFEDPAQSAVGASLYLKHGRLTGSINFGNNQRIVVSSASTGVSTVIIQDAMNDLPCATTGRDMPGQPAADANDDGGLAGLCDDGSVIDVLVYYTDDAATEAGGEQAMRDMLDWVFAQSNEIYQDSTIQTSVRLIAAVRAEGYNDNTQSMYGDLVVLTERTDGHLDEAHALRDELGADLVALIRSSGSDACGMAWLLPANTPAYSAIGFSVTAVDCLMNTTFTHELGHNMGCCHAAGDGGGCQEGGVFPYSLGHRFTDTTNALCRTIMAYAPGTKITRFTSPDVYWMGVATGSAVKDNARTINETRQTVASFRCSPTGNTCGAAGSCFALKNSPGCSDPVCCNTVCAVDPHCCASMWDAVCASSAIELCASCGESNAGSCFEAHQLPSCADAACCSAVCTSDAFCCEAIWDGACADGAYALCLSCGHVETESCFAVHNTSYCNDASCCSSVCAVDPSCCASGWDASCVASATSLCAICGNPSGGSCLIARNESSCSDLACCSIVCAADPSCCDASWDANCATAAAIVCVESCGGSLAGSCCEAHNNPSCDDAVCCQSVCLIDSFCCATQWDARCTENAIDTCAVCCPGDLSLDRVIGPVDLALLLWSWGSDWGDVNGDGETNAADMALLLGEWGPCR